MTPTLLDLYRVLSQMSDEELEGTHLIIHNKTDDEFFAATELSFADEKESALDKGHFYISYETQQQQ